MDDDCDRPSDARVGRCAARSAARCGRCRVRATLRVSMAAFFVDGATIEPALLGTNDGLNYGRFDAPGLEVHAYEVRVGIEEVLAAKSADFDKLVEEMRTDDLLDDEPSALMRMGYPTMRDAFAHPDDLREVIRIFMDRE